jgi:hypothetical protein
MLLFLNASAASATSRGKTSGNMCSPGSKAGQTTCYLIRTYHLLSTFAARTLFRFFVKEYAIREKTHSNFALLSAKTGSARRMTRTEVVLSALAAGGENATFLPVQVQKLFFLIDREASHLVGGRKFSFEPCDYGQFDSAVYEELDVAWARDVVAQ